MTATTATKPTPKSTPTAPVPAPTNTAPAPTAPTAPEAAKVSKPRAPKLDFGDISASVVPAGTAMPSQNRESAVTKTPFYKLVEQSVKSKNAETGISPAMQFPVPSAAHATQAEQYLRQAAKLLESGITIRFGKADASGAVAVFFSTKPKREYKGRKSSETSGTAATSPAA